jgi:HAE1 family hydrophobic/amphiphilic exporter-1
VNVQGDDIFLLKKYAAALKEKKYQIPGIVDIEVTLEQDIPEYRLTVDRERAFDVGITTGHIVRTAGALVGGQTVTTYEDEDGDSVNVRVRLSETLRQDLSHVEKLRLAVQKPGNGATLIPLGELVTYSIKPTPSEIDRQAGTLPIPLWQKGAPAGQ